MKRIDLEHIIRAAAEIADDTEIIVIGSQAILGSFPNAPEILLISMEADVYPKNHPERSDLIDGSIGELSPFHDEFGYYAQGVDETTAILPDGWKDRLVLVRNENTRGAGEMEAAIAEGAPAGAVAIMNAIDSGDIKAEGGSKQDVQKFFSYFDEPVDVGSINLIVR